ncbi:unnamed protein product [Fusarium graminearum]|uniref:Uncharacterized protein n=1 Tax=Gibberella zeae TaxID=5518 RepID=A0A4E9EQI2_GIBZA|nr:unnamed protein product [Fusarium graminearum]
MHRTQAIEQTIGFPNHGRAIPIFFGDIKISLDDFYPQALPPSPKTYTTIFFVESLTNVAFYAVRREMAMP